MIFIGVAHILNLTREDKNNLVKVKFEVPEDFGKILSVFVPKGSKVPNPNASQKGYDLLGWYLNDTKWDFANDRVYENTTLVSKWDLHHYQITYNTLGGTNDTQNPTSYTIKDGRINLLPATRTGHEFQGWNDEHGNVRDYIESFWASDFNFTAVWYTNLYAFSYTCNYENVIELTEYCNQYGYGEEVCIRFSVTDGYEIDTITSDQANLSYITSTSFKYIVPAEDVVVHFEVKAK